jgi:hypothetical protein
MRFYRINYYAISDTDQATEWATSQKEAARIARENRCGDYEAKIESVDIPMTRAGMIAFLNENIFTHPCATVPWGG